MASLAQPLPMSVEEFLRWEPEDGLRYELESGVPKLAGEPLVRDGRTVAMAGGTTWHAKVSGNLLVALTTRLRGRGCITIGSDAVLQTREDTARLPDIGVYCDPRDLDFRDDEYRALRFPLAVFEVLSPSTRASDLSRKLAEYKEIVSVRSIVYVDPVPRTFETWERLGEREWHNESFLPGATLRLTGPPLEISSQEIFARD